MNASNKNYLLDLSTKKDVSEELAYLVHHFLGVVIEEVNLLPQNEMVRVYAMGDIAKLQDVTNEILVIEELSYHFETMKENFQKVRLGEVPINMYDAGVYYRDFFEEKEYFAQITSEHQFQDLTESNKPSLSSRKGIYISKVSKIETKEKEEAFDFHLLRCSTNLSGATDNFRQTDHDIVNRINHVIKYDFKEKSELNHVLAQIYENRRELNGKESKAKIKAHSDKTKDMPSNALMAFCTFYEKDKFADLHPSKKDRFDWCYKNTSGLTRLLFKLKPTVKDESLVKEFSVTLYPNSLFIISLLTNRLYTHEIKPSSLNVERIPTRMGYVVRCSNLQARYCNGETYIKEDEDFTKLIPMDNKSIEDLRESYYKENKLESMVDYGKIHFSMNLGDYEKPNY